MRSGTARLDHGPSSTRATPREHLGPPVREHRRHRHRQIHGHLPSGWSTLGRCARSSAPIRPRASAPWCGGDRRRSCRRGPPSAADRPCGTPPSRTGTECGSGIPLVDRPGSGRLRRARSAGRDRWTTGSGTGTADSSASVYGCFGLVYTASDGPCSTMRPRYITAIRSLTWRTTERSCAMNRYATPSSRWSSRMRLITCACVETSRELTGSSHTTSSGLIASARRDREPLQLPARELVRVSLEVLAPEPDERHELSGAVLAPVGSWARRRGVARRCSSPRSHAGRRTNTGPGRSSARCGGRRATHGGTAS